MIVSVLFHCRYRKVCTAGQVLASKQSFSLSHKPVVLNVGHVALPVGHARFLRGHMRIMGN